MIDIKEMNVLIVDDAIPMCRSILKMMKILGYGQKHHVAHSGKKALNILQQEPIDVVLLDHNMPGMNGAETLSHIREDRDLRDLPVIMVTAEAYKEYVSEAGESSVDAYMLKPFTMHLLKEKISSVVEKANNPPPMVYHLRKARDFEDEGHIDAAIKQAGLAMEANPNSSRPMRDLGYYYFKNNDLKMAEKWLLKAAEKNHLDVFAFHYLGELYLKQNDIEKAQHYFEKAMEISPRHLDRGIKFAKILVQMKMITRAIQVFDQVLKLSGSSVELREEIADFCIEEGVYEYAIQLLESILRERPNRRDLYFKLGKTLEKKGDIMEAVSCFDEAEKVDEENEDIKIHLAKNYLALNKPVLAEKTLKKVLKINPDNSLATDLLRKCA